MAEPLALAESVASDHRDELAALWSPPHWHRSPVAN